MSKGKQTRDHILLQALSEASRFGLEGLSIGTLARDVGMSKSGLFAHFGSKSGLQNSVVQLASDLFVDAVFRPAVKLPPGEPRVQAMFDNWIAWASSPTVPGGCLFMSSSFEFDDRPGPVRDNLVVQISQLHDTLKRATAIAIEEGHFRSDLDISQFAFQWHSLMLGFHVQARLFRAPNANNVVGRAFESLLATARS
ncbi:MAG: TetR family transcriptional regulator [Rhodobacterales bacterium]|nr:TetR family transcriptional regulator [Rhodobacterales bacterium]